MTVNNDPRQYPFVLDPGFVQLLNHVLEDTKDGVIFNFRDPTYSAETGGFHPVEICVDDKGVLQYVTDFSYAGMPPFVELGIELDWSFENGYFRQFDTMHELVVGQALFHLWAQNFIAYHGMGVYEVTVSPL